MLLQLLVVSLLLQTSPLRRILNRRPGPNETVMVATESVPVCVCERAAGAAGAVVATAAFSVATKTAAATAVAAAAAAADAVVEMEAALAGMVTSEALNGQRATHASRAWARPCEAASLAGAASPCEAPSLPKL